MLRDIHLLRSDRYLTKKEIIRKIILGYNLVHLSMNKLSLSNKIKAVLNEAINPKYLNVLNKYEENDTSLSVLFILGFILGDGSFSIRIRDSGKGI